MRGLPSGKGACHAWYGPYLPGNGAQDIISIAKMTARDLAPEHTDQATQIFGTSGLITYSRV